VARTLTAVTYRLELAQRLTLMKNVWEVTRTDGPARQPVAKVAQARLKLREQVTCTTPDDNATIFTLRARNLLELGGTYDVTEYTGAHLGTITKDFAASLGRSTYRIETPSGNWTVTETNPTLAILRRVVSIVADVPWLLRVQFSILDETGRQVGHVNRANMRIKDTYDILVEDDRLDMRMAIAAGVAVDAFMNR